MSEERNSRITKNEKFTKMTKNKNNFSYLGYNSAPQAQSCTAVHNMRQGYSE